jgi:hypothetical protein
VYFIRNDDEERVCIVNLGRVGEKREEGRDKGCREMVDLQAVDCKDGLSDMSKIGMYVRSVPAILGLFLGVVHDCDVVYEDIEPILLFLKGCHKHRDGEDQTLRPHLRDVRQRHSPNQSLSRS